MVGESLAAQAEQALRNVQAGLEAAGANYEDLARLTIYVVAWEPAMLADLGAGLLAARAPHPWIRVPITIIGVHSLFEPSMRIEIEAVAVAP